MTVYQNVAIENNTHPDSRMTLREAFERHYDKADLAKSTLRKIRHTLNAWEKNTDNPPVGRITVETARKFRDALLASGAGPATVNVYWLEVRCILRRLAPAETGNPGGLGIIPSIPYLKRLRVRRKPPRRIDLTDLTKFYIACKFAQHPRGTEAVAYWRAFVTVAYCAGLRKGDLMALRWENVDLQEGCLRFTAQKTGKPDVFPLHPVAVEHLRRIQKPTGRVFHGMYVRGGRFYKTWKRIAERAQVEYFTPHDIRRTGASEVERVRPGMGKWFLQHAARTHTDASYLNLHPELCEAVQDMRIPPGWRSAIGMQEKAAEKQRKERLQFRPNDFVGPQTPSPDDWQFRQGTFQFRGTWFRLSGRRLLVLKTLAMAAAPVEVRTLVRIVFGETADVECYVLQRRVVTLVSAIRSRLRRVFGLDDGFDPVPCLEIGNGGAWAISLPVGLVPEKRQPGGGMAPGDLIRRARRRAGWTIQELANRIGASKPAVQRWESGESAIPPAWLDAMKRVLADHLDRAARPQPTNGHPLTPGELRHARYRAGWPQNELARRVGCSTESVNAWERGRWPIPADWAERLKETLGPYLDGPAVPVLSGTEIKAARERAGWSQLQLAKLIGTDRKTVYTWERGLHKPSAKVSGTLYLLLRPHLNGKPKGGAA